MVRYAKPTAVLLVSAWLTGGQLWAAESVNVDFSANIFDGTCEIQLSDSTIDFGFHRNTAFPASSAVAIRPLIATVNCTSATTPKLTVSGNAPYASQTIFRDADSAANGAGFMVRRDIGGINIGNFYDEAQAISNNVPVSLAPIPEATPQNESFILGLVRAGSNTVTAGTIKATLTFTVAFD
ncbi:fimbrial protein [Serratia microhaemolytica]|uniref:fimbrial protein n=1 Tax=Serratia microhaemolytica TaxID=2675110 RepID=UPI000FDEC136|nr:fimbrial protein [Serratia microhaemolytica]